MKLYDLILRIILIFQGIFSGLRRKNQFLTFIIPLTIFFEITDIQAQICEPSSKPTPHMGAHISPEFTNLWNMLNAGYGANYGSANMGNHPGGHAMVYLDKDGWPRANKEHTMTVNFNKEQNPNLKVEVGDLFHCQYRGTSSQLTLTSTDVKIVNLVEAGGMVTFDFEVLKLEGGIYFKIDGKITDIQIMRPGYELNDPRMVTDECKDYLRGLQVVRLMGQSGCNRNYEREWEYRTPANAPFEAWVSNGDENNINGQQGESCFDERGNNPWLSNSFNQSRSYPWEKAIDLCNYLDVDFYANVPVLADLNYMHKLAKVVKSRLKPTLNLYVEIGNELWNFGGGGAFHGFAMSFAAVHNMVKVQGDQTIVGDPSKGIQVETGSYGDGSYWTGGLDAYTAARRWPAYRLKQFMDEFAKEFGFAEQGGVGVRIRGILAGQRSYGWGADYWFIGNEGVYFLEKQFGAGTAKKYLYGLSIASYVNVKDDPSKSVDEMTNLSVNEIIKQINEDMHEQFGQFGQEGDCRTNPDANCEGNELEDILAFAKRFGLKVVAYEGGPECNVQRDGAWIPMKNIVAAYNSPQMYTHIKTYMTKWYSWMGYDALFIKNGFYTDKGYGAGYSVAETLGELSQQYTAYRDIMDTPAPPLTNDRGGIIGLGKVSNLPGWQIASYDFQQFQRSTISNEYGPAGRRRLDGTKTFTKDVYIIRNETSGSYGLNLLMSWNGGNSRYDIYMDGKLIKENWLLNQPSPDGKGETPRLSDTLKFDIPYGTHAIHFTKTNDPGGSIDLISMRFTLLKEGPPAKPDLIYGDLVVCKGNTKAKYEVSPVDFSVCDYEWSGLPASATILPKTTTNPITGQGTFKMYADWGNTPNGVYDLQVIAKNQSKLPGNAWMSSEPRLFKVTVQTCGFEINPTPICLNQNTTFTPVLMPDAVEYRWDLGAGANPNRSITKTSNDPVVAKYTTEGKIDVKLITKNAAGEDKIYYNVLNVTSCNSPIVVSPVNYCKGAPAEPLTATPANSGTDLKWYTSSTGGTALSAPPTPSTATVGTTTYWVTQMNNGGTVESDRSKIDVIITDAPSAPVVTAISPYCIGAVSKIEDLTSKVTITSGTIAKWYTSNTATTSVSNPTAPSTASANNVSWFVSQAIGSCESPKVELKVNVVAGPEFTVAAIDPATCGEKGKITLTGLTADASYNVSYNTVAAAPFTASATGEILLELASGSYNKIKVDNFSCSSTDDNTYTITDPTPPAFTVLMRQPKVCGALGALALKGLKTNTAYKVSYNNGAELAFSSQGDSIVMPLSKGTYSNLKVLLGKCSKVDPGTYQLEEPVVVPPVAQPGTIEFCQNQIVNVSDITSRVQGDPAYSLRWYTSLDGAPASQPTVSTATSGSKSLWVSQANGEGCSSDKVMLNVQINPSTSLNATGTNPTACGATDGKLLIRGLQNMVGYKVEYKKEGESQPIKNIYSSQTGELMIEGLGGGTYNSITVTPQTGNICLTKGAEEVTLTEPGSPAAPFITGAKDYCTGETIAPLSATGTAIEWYSDAALTTQVGTGTSFTPPLTSGTASYYAIENVAGCKSLPATATISIIAAPAVRAVIGNGGPASCNGTGYNLILPTEIGVNYFIYKDESLEVVASAIGEGREQVLGSVSEIGIYTVKAEAKEGSCKAEMTGSLVVTSSKTPEVYELKGNTICEGSAPTVDVILLGSENDVNYSLLHNGAQVAELLGTGESLIFPRETITSSTGEYTIKATIPQSGCSIDMPTKADIIVQGGVSEPSLTGDIAYCNKGTSQITATSVSAGANQTWTISPTTAGTIDNTGMITWNNAYTGEVTVSLKVSSTACSGTEKTASFTTNTTTLPTIEAINGDDIVCRGNIKQYQVSPVGSGMTYAWEITSNVSIKQKDDATGTVTLEYHLDIPSEGIEIKVSPLSAQCGAGTAVLKTVKKGEGCDIFVPNVLTPSSTDNNSVWAIEGINNFPNLIIQVFNRWGGKVYSNMGLYTKPWDGTHNGSPLPTATYYYVIDKADGSEKITGSITLMRD